MKILVKCRNCNNEFLKHESDIKRSKNNFCSRRCFHNSRIGLSCKTSNLKPSTINKNIPKEIWAYLAGIIDGEGTINIYGTGRRRSVVTVVITNTNQELLSFLSNEIADSKFEVLKPSRQRFSKNEFYRIVWYRLLDINEILKNVIPFLIIKHDKAKRALDIVKQHLQIYGIQG